MCREVGLSVLMVGHHVHNLSFAKCIVLMIGMAGKMHLGSLLIEQDSKFPIKKY
jgi:hypothetical protein